MQQKSRTHSNTFVTTVRGLALVGFAVATVAFVLSVIPGLLAQSPACSAGMQEAEDGIMYGFEVGTDGSASGGEYLHLPDGGGSQWSPSPAYRAEYCFDVAVDGDYQIEDGVWSTDGTNDSFYVAVDGSMLGDGRWDITHQVDYGMDYVNTYQVTDPTIFSLAAGAHTVEVYLREDGARLDTLQLIEVEPPPAPDCQRGWYEAEDAVVQGMTVERSYIHVPEGNGSHWSASDAYSATFCMTVRRDGLYRINGRTLASSSSSDSFFAKIDDGAVWTWFVAQSRRYRNDLANDYLNDDPVELWLAAGDHTVTIYAREDGTRLDRVRLERVRQRNCTAGRMEAEDAQVTGFDVGLDGTASGGSYVYAPDGSGSSWSPSEDNKVEFCFTVGAAGTYELQTGVWADAGTNDSFWVKVNGVSHGRWDTAINTSYEDDMVGVSTADPLILDLPAGDHSVEILLREDGTRLDWVALIPTSGS